MYWFLVLILTVFIVELKPDLLFLLRVRVFVLFNDDSLSETYITPVSTIFPPPFHVPGV